MWGGAAVWAAPMKSAVSIPVYFATLALAVDRQSAVARPGPVLVVATLAYAGLALALFAQALAGLPVIAL